MTRVTNKNLHDLTTKKRVKNDQKTGVQKGSKMAKNGGPKNGQKRAKNGLFRTIKKKITRVYHT
jgi:hypothetical protein